MAPKTGLSPAQRLEKILDYFRQSKTCHTLKDLESVLPSVASVHRIQVKDLIKDLTDENKVKVEKIGSGNWYWCWAGEETREKNNAIAHHDAEKSKLDASNASLNERVQILRQDHATAQTDSTHQEFLRLLGPLEEDVKALAAERDGWENAVAGGVEGIRADADGAKAEVATLTDSIYILEGHLQHLLGGDRETMELVRRDCYGAYYDEDEGLPDLQGI